MLCSIGYIWWPYAFLSNWPLVDPGWSLHNLTPTMSYTLIRSSSYQIWWPYGISKPFDLWLTPVDPCMTFDPSNALHFGQEFFRPNLVAIGHCQKNWPLDDLQWPLHDLWPQQWTTGPSTILVTKFGTRRAFLDKLTSRWPLVTFAWPLTSTMNYGSLNDPCHQIWYPLSIPRQTDL